jgi:hypothetical protein
MGPFEMVVAIVAIVMVAGVLRARYQAHGKDGESRNPLLPDPDTDRMRDELKALKERVAVLERIATENDRGISLDREIEKLRTRD